MDAAPDPADALAEIERVQQKAYADQRLPLWYMPGVIALAGAAAVAAELDGVAWLVLVVADIAGVGALTAALAARVRVRWRPGTWTVSASVRMVLWLVSILAVCWLALVAVGSAGGSAVWQRAAAGAAAALYTAATTRWVENQVLAHSAGRVVR
ncbi:hypothetical protein GCM10019016_052250 [Streptomyces prasinosporus]|uniref:Holin n=1 Tax=Streptomyces prasinosporus TaxID=68256 RepID=A0ABP6TSS3_9ACTN